MPTDYIPAPDDTFATFAARFTSTVTAAPANYGLTTQQSGNLTAAADDWTSAFTGFRGAEDAFHGATVTKDETRTAYETLIRSGAQSIQRNPAVSDDMRTAAGLPIYKDTRTATSVPSTTPTLQKVDSSSRAILRLFFVDSATPTKRVKPDGVMYCEIREQIGGAAPVNPDTMAFLASETRTPYRADFEPEEVGKTVYFALRWVNTRGEHGPWSEIFTEVVPG